MDLQKLEYFKVVAKYENMTKASKELFVSQPAISKAINSLEDSFGCNLFDRKEKSIKLNDAGRILLKYIEKIDLNLLDARKELNDHLNTKNKTIHLSLHAGSSLIIDIITSFQQKYPDVNFKLTQDYNKEEFYDVLIKSRSVKSNKENVYCLVTEPILLALPKNHRLASKESIHLSELKDEEFVGLTKDKDLRSMTDHYCQSLGYTPKIIWEADYPSISRKMISAGLGIAFMPQKTWQSLSKDDIRIIKILDENFIRHVEIEWREGSYLSQATKKFIAFTIEYYKNL